MVFPPAVAKVCSLAGNCNCNVCRKVGPIFEKLQFSFEPGLLHSKGIHIDDGEFHPGSWAATMLRRCATSSSRRTGWTIDMPAAHNPTLCQNSYTLKSDIAILCLKFPSSSLGG